MRRELPRRLLLLALPLLMLHPAVAQRKHEPELLQETASGSYDLQGESLLVLEGISGTLSLRASPNDALRFEARVLNSQRKPQEVALWRSGTRTLLLGPGAEVAQEGLLLEIMIPDSLDVDVIFAGGRVLVSAIGGDLLVEAEGTKVQARGLRGGAEFLLDGGVLTVDGVKGEFAYKGTNVTADVQHLYGEAVLRLEQGKTSLNALEGGVQVESEQTVLTLTSVKGLAEVEAVGGSVSVSSCIGGGELQLEEAPLSLVLSKGDFAVRSDASVEFGSHEGRLSIFGRGAPIQGNQVDGPLTIESDSAAVTLNKISGSTEVRGSDLKLNVENGTGPLAVSAISSEIVVNGNRAEVLLENEFGDVKVGDCMGTLKLQTSNGNVEVSDHDGPLDIRADGPEVRVGWKKFTKSEASTIYNASGDVHVALPAGGRCTVQLEAPFGRVDTALAGVRVADDGRSGSGEVTGGRGSAPQMKKPTIKARSGGGNVYLGMGSGKE